MLPIVFWNPEPKYQRYHPVEDTVGWVAVPDEEGGDEALRLEL
jgi:hypothetical protein